MRLLRVSIVLSSLTIGAAAAVVACATFNSSEGNESQIGDDANNTNDVAISSANDASLTDADSSTTSPDGAPSPICIPQAIGVFDASTMCDAGEVDLATSTTNCGRCGHECLGESCTNGMCDGEQIASEASADTTIGSITNTTLYFGVNGGQSYSEVHSIDLPGVKNGASKVITQIGPDSNQHAGHPIPSGDRVFFLYLTGIESALITGSPTHNIIARDPNSTPFGNLALTSDHLYYWNDNGLTEVLHDGGAPQLVEDVPLAQGTIAALGADGANAFWVLSRFDNQADITLVTRNNGASITRAHNLPANIEAIAFDDTYVYLGDGASAQVWRVPKAGGTAEIVLQATPFPAAPAHTKGIAVDDTRVYISLAAGVDELSEDTDLWEAPKCGGPSRRIGHVKMTRGGLESAGSYLFFGGPGAIVRLSK